MRLTLMLVLMLVLVPMLELDTLALPLPATCLPRVTGRLGTTTHATAMAPRMRAADDGQTQGGDENQFVHDVFPF